MKPSNAERAVLFAAGVFVGLAAGLPTGLAIAEPRDHQVTHPEATPTSTVQTTISEDDPAWDCRTMGNRVCGPETATPGCWDEHGKLVGIWPCHVVVDPETGEGDVYAGLRVTR
ncbi:hypothetical protein SEA_DONNY_65 [Mycobacterium phage Donny]|uniref:Membrane protein n=3 Tax=Acadianvirus acadian TaxID=1982901 RepID=A0A7M1CMS1_9CAUD|nr:hypothetical protein CM14_gp64 [Mycobacterium phage Acadian]AER48977.1 hypothetical protein ACADIAN_64 [Mycobacterium phage Acadian]QBI96423.1 hypothetical protein SEA_DONNY_65 [Mycobacterium phage Donny]QOP65606.1 membrane protein [Mycobacterium phage Suigeneris]